MSVNKYEVQKMYDAAKDVTLDAAAKKDPTILLGADLSYFGNSDFIFKNEYERKMFLVGLKASQVEEAIIAVEKDTVGLTAKEKPEYLEVLKKMQAEIGAIRTTAHKELEETKFVINALIPDIEEEEESHIMTEKPAGNTEEKESDPFTEIAETLKVSLNVTRQIRINAYKIQEELLKAPKKNDVLEIIEILVNSEKSNKDFQIALGMKEGAGADEADGILGPITINILLKKAGVDYQLPVPKKETFASDVSVARGDDVSGKPQKRTSEQESEEMKTSSNSDIFKNSKTSLIFKDGAYYLTGPKGRPTRIDFQSIAQSIDIPKEAPENLQKSVAMAKDFSEILDAYLVKYPDKKQKYESALIAMKGAFNQPDIRNGKSVLGMSMSIQMLDEKKLYDIFKITDSKSRHLKVLEFIREDLEQSDMVAKSVMENYKKDFQIDDEKIMNGDISGITFSDSQKQEVEKVIDNARIEAAKNWKDHKSEYMEAFKKENPEVSVTENQAREWNEKLTVLTMAKREIFYQKLYNTSFADEELSLLKDILGAGTWDMSDRSKDMSGEAAKIIGIEAIALAAGIFTAGAGTVAINTLAFGRNAYRGARALEAYNTASRTRQISTTFGRILGSGAGFELGHANMISLIEDGTGTLGTKEGYIQSIAMMGVLSGIGKLIQSGKLGAGIQFKEGAGFWKNTLPFTGQTAIEGIAIFGTVGTASQLLVDGHDNWTPEQLVQAMLMAAIFKGVSRVKISKKPNGEIEVKPVEENISSSKVLSERAPIVREYSEGQILKNAPEKIKFINEAQPGDIVRLNKMGTLKKLPDGRWSLTNGSEVRYFETNEALAADAIARRGKGSKNFIIERLADQKIVTNSSVNTQSEAVADGRVQEILNAQKIQTTTSKAPAEGIGSGKGIEKLMSWFKRGEKPVKPEGLMSESEKKGLIAKFGETKFAEFMKKTDAKIAELGGENSSKVMKWIFDKNSSWGESIATGVVLQVGVTGGAAILDGTFKDDKTVVGELTNTVKDLNSKDAGELIVETLALRYIRWGLAMTGTGLYALRDAGIIQWPKNKTDASPQSTEAPVIPPAPTPMESE